MAHAFGDNNLDMLHGGRVLGSSLSSGSVVQRASNVSSLQLSPLVSTKSGSRIITVLGGVDSEFQNLLAEKTIEAALPWAVFQADNVASSLALLKNHTVDVFICDMRQSASDGPALLKQVKDLSPQTLRILICNSVDQDVALRAMNVAHRVILKPYRTEVLVEVIARAYALRDLMLSERVRQAVGRVESLPAAPKIYLRLTEALQDPDTSTGEVSDIVSQDPALALKVLHLANSAFFSPGRQIADIRSAVGRLGLRTIRHLVLASEVFSCARPPGIDVDAMQRRALLASVLAPLVLDNWAEAELARTAALVADVGMLLPNMLQWNAKDEKTHAEAGGYLLNLWGLPEAVVEAVSHHHNPSVAGESSFGLVGAVHVAVMLISDQAVDETYLKAHGLLDKLVEWRKLMRELTAMV